MEERFVYRKPPIGKAKAAVVVDDLLRIEHPMLKTPLLVPMADLGAAVRVTEHEDQEPVLHRDARVLDLPSSGFTESNVVIIFRDSIRIPRFKFGADQALAISGRQRRRGLEVDGIGVTVEEPDALTAALSRHQVRLFPSVAAALSDVVGLATGEEAVERRGQMARRRSWARLQLLGWGIVWTTLLAARFAFGGDDEGVPASTVVGFIASSLAWAAFIAVAVSSLRPREGARRPIRDRSSGWEGLALLGAMAAMLAVPIVVAGWMASHLGTPRVFAYGLIAGVPGGLLCGLALRMTRPPDNP